MSRKFGALPHDIHHMIADNLREDDRSKMRNMLLKQKHQSALAYDETAPRKHKEQNDRFREWIDQIEHMPKDQIKYHMKKLHDTEGVYMVLNPANRDEFAILVRQKVTTTKYNGYDYGYGETDFDYKKTYALMFNSILDKNKNVIETQISDPIASIRAFPLKNNFWFLLEFLTTQFDHHVNGHLVELDGELKEIVLTEMGPLLKTDTHVYTLLEYDGHGSILRSIPLREPLAAQVWEMGKESYFANLEWLIDEIEHFPGSYRTGKNLNRNEYKSVDSGFVATNLGHIYNKARKSLKKLRLRKRS